MRVQTWIRWSAVLVAGALVSGCSILGGKDDDGGSGRSAGSGSNADIQCRISRSSCMYEGRYESDERDYAEEEAARRNRAELDRVRSW